jgi:hypothetical protein
MLEIQLILINQYGEFRGRVVHLTNEDYVKLQEMSKSFYMGGFELTLEDGSFMVFSPEIVKNSILKIEKKETQDVQE